MAISEFIKNAKKKKKERELKAKIKAKELKRNEYMNSIPRRIDDLIDVTRNSDLLDESYDSFGYKPFIPIAMAKLESSIIFLGMNQEKRKFELEGRFNNSSYDALALIIPSFKFNKSRNCYCLSQDGLDCLLQKNEFTRKLPDDILKLYMEILEFWNNNDMQDVIFFDSEETFKKYRNKMLRCWESNVDFFKQKFCEHFQENSKIQSESDNNSSLDDDAINIMEIHRRNHMIMKEMQRDFFNDNIYNEINHNIANEINEKTTNAGEKGEEKVEYELSWLKKDNPSYYLISKDCESKYGKNRIVLKCEGYECQEFDHIVVSPYGVFCIETKNLVGKINITSDGDFIREAEGREYGMENPVSQMDRHHSVLASLIKDVIDEKYIYDILCFANTECIIIGKENFEYPIVRYDKIKRHIMGYTDVVVDDEQISKVIKRIEDAKIKHVPEDSSARNNVTNNQGVSSESHVQSSKPYAYGEFANQQNPSANPYGGFAPQPSSNDKKATIKKEVTV